MGITKYNKFTDEQNEIAQYAKVLSHPARVAILQYLGKIKACVCGDIVNEIGLAQATISQHLKELKRIGIIDGEIEGARVCYCINYKNWKKLQLQLNSLLNNNLDIGKLNN